MSKLSPQDEYEKLQRRLQCLRREKSNILTLQRTLSNFGGNPDFPYQEVSKFCNTQREIHNEDVVEFFEDTRQRISVVEAIREAAKVVL